MRIIFNDVIQNSTAPEKLKTPALADTYTLDETTEIIFKKPEYLDCIAIGNLKSTNNNAVIKFIFWSSYIIINGGNAEDAGVFPCLKGGNSLNEKGLNILSNGDASSNKYEIIIDNAIKSGFYYLPVNRSWYSLIQISIVSGSGITIGRIAAGRAVNIPTAISKEPGYQSTAEPRKTLSGQIMPGAGGYNYKILSLDSRYKLDRTAFNEIEAGYRQIGNGYPFFIDLSDEEYKLPYNFLYATEKNQRQMSFESGVRKFLYSRRWDFEEAF